MEVVFLSNILSQKVAIVLYAISIFYLMGGGGGGVRVAPSILGQYIRISYAHGYAAYPSCFSENAFCPSLVQGLIKALNIQLSV